MSDPVEVIVLDDTPQTVAVESSIPNSVTLEVIGLGGGGSGSITLTGDVTGSGTGTINTALATTVGVLHGGTGHTSLSAHGVLLGNGTSGVNVASPSTAGYVLTDNGASADPSFSPLPPATPSAATNIYNYQNFS